MLKSYTEIDLSLVWLSCQSWLSVMADKVFLIVVLGSKTNQWWLNRPTSVVVVVILLSLDVQLFLELSAQQVQPLVCGSVLSLGSPPVQVLQHSKADLLHPGRHTDRQRERVRLKAEASRLLLILHSSSDVICLFVEKNKKTRQLKRCLRCNTTHFWTCFSLKAHSLRHISSMICLLLSTWPWSFSGGRVASRALWARACWIISTSARPAGRPWPADETASEKWMDKPQRQSLEN